MTTEYDVVELDGVGVEDILNVALKVVGSIFVVGVVVLLVVRDIVGVSVTIDILVVSVVLEDVGIPVTVVDVVSFVVPGIADISVVLDCFCGTRLSLWFLMPRVL